MEERSKIPQKKRAGTSRFEGRHGHASVVFPKEGQLALWVARRCPTTVGEFRDKVDTLAVSSDKKRRVLKPIRSNARARSGLRFPETLERSFPRRCRKTFRKTRESEVRVFLSKTTHPRVSKVVGGRGEKQRPIWDSRWFLRVVGDWSRALDDRKLEPTLVTFQNTLDRPNRTGKDRDTSQERNANRSRHVGGRREVRQMEPRGASSSLGGGVCATTSERRDCPALCFIYFESARVFCDKRRATRLPSPNAERDSFFAVCARVVFFFLLHCVLSNCSRTRTASPTCGTR